MKSFNLYYTKIVRKDLVNKSNIVYNYNILKINSIVLKNYSKLYNKRNQKFFFRFRNALEYLTFQRPKVKKIIKSNKFELEAEFNGFFNKFHLKIQKDSIFFYLFNLFIWNKWYWSILTENEEIFNLKFNAKNISCFFDRKDINLFLLHPQINMPFTRNRGCFIFFNYSNFYLIKCFFSYWGFNRHL